MKTVVLIRSNPVNPDPPVEKMASTLLSLGYNVVVLAWDRDSNHKCIKEIKKYGSKRVVIFRWGIQAIFGGGLKNIKGLAVFESCISVWLKRNHDKYDIIHAFDFDTGFISQRIAKRYDKKFVYHILDYYAAAHTTSPKMCNVLSKAENSVINKSDVVFICTDARKKQIEGTHPKQLYVIHNAPQNLECGANKKEYERATEKVNVAYIGTLGDYRFIPELIEVVKSDSRLQLHVGGYGLYAKDIEKASLACERIVYYGQVPYEKTLEIESNCDLMVAMYDPNIANHKYSAPNKFYESLMLGKPIIMAKGTGWDEVISSNKLGVTVPFTIEGFRAGISEMMAILDNREYDADLVHQFYRDNYSWDIMEQRIRLAYMEL